MFQKVLVANRGEIAVRIIRALQEMRIRSVAVYSAADRAALHVRIADEAGAIGPAASSESYLRIDKIVAAARAAGADAVHPGYGFLSENADFADACHAAGIVFIGPSAASIRAMGSKTAARQTALRIGAPVVPGNDEALTGLPEARDVASRIGYPVLLKAAAGGGGKGMRRVDSEGDLESALRDASSEAGRAFGNPAIYIEKLIENPRHIEIQILGDQHGHMVHLGERECSIQRRHQKIIEECPSPLVATRPELRDRMGRAAIQIARAVDYHNAGTVEFLANSNGDFYFLEMNTRLQVEHPVTELVTGLDLVHLQLRIASGEKLPFDQDAVQWRGAALECRIYAEDPHNNFLPSPGRMQHVERPSGPGVRLDSGIYAGWGVPLEYDPLLAKLSVWADTRDAAIARMRRALGEYYVSGITTNIPFLRQILDDPEFLAGRQHTGFIQDFFARTAYPEERLDPEYEAMVALAAGLFASSDTPASSPNVSPASNWLTEGRARNMR